MNYDRVSPGTCRLPLGWYAVLNFSSSARLGGAVLAVSLTPFGSKGAAKKRACVAAKASRALMRRPA